MIIFYCIFQEGIIRIDTDTQWTIYISSLHFLLRFKMLHFFHNINVSALLLTFYALIRSLFFIGTCPFRATTRPHRESNDLCSVFPHVPFHFIFIIFIFFFSTFSSYCFFPTEKFLQMK